MIAALFHVAYIIAHRLRGFDALVMEVNPRHVRYYERMLGARVLLLGMDKMIVRPERAPGTRRHFVHIDKPPAALAAVGHAEVVAHSG